MDIIYLNDNNEKKKSFKSMPLLIKGQMERLLRDR